MNIFDPFVDQCDLIFFKKKKEKKFIFHSIDRSIEFMISNYNEYKFN